MLVVYTFMYVGGLYLYVCWWSIPSRKLIRDSSSNKHKIDIYFGIFSLLSDKSVLLDYIK